MGKKDQFNGTLPVTDNAPVPVAAVDHPELAGLLNVLYPGVFPNLAANVAAGTARADLDAILLTGVPAGVITGFPGNYTGPSRPTCCG